MATVRVLLLTTICILTLGAPALQAQNARAQDVLPQEPPQQELQDSQASEDHAARTQGSSAKDAEIRNGSITSHERARSKDKDQKDNAKPVAQEALTNPVIWRDPGDISSKDLFWGPGSPQRRPRPPFTFVREILQGHNPKFDCRDANGKRWRVKLGSEARPEVVASRLLWAIGYFADENYVLPKAQVRGLKMERTPSKQKGTTVTDARFERRPAGQHKVGTWKWRDNPFFGTREFNGLRVMMAVMNNWDLKTANNAVYEARGGQQQFFLVNDVGSSFGKHTIEFASSSSKGNPKSYERSKFIVRNDGVVVDFATPQWPKGILARSVGLGAMAFAELGHLEWIGRDIPVPDAHWIGTQLGQLSHQQLVDAFRAGNYPPDEIERFVTVLEARIRELQGL